MDNNLDIMNTINENKNITIPHYRAIILILASNESQITKNARTIWKQYMNVEPTFKVFFVYAQLFEPLVDRDDSDIVFDNIREGLTFHKTFHAMKYIDKHFSYEYFVRTNISTFWDFKNLKKHLDILPKSGCYSGDGPFSIRELNHSCLYLSGSDTIVTKEMITSLVSNPEKINFDLIEDQTMGHYFNGVMGIPPLPNRICFFEDIHNVDEYTQKIIENRINTSMENNIDHYRVKSKNNNRCFIDYFIYIILLEKIYNIKNIN